MPEPTTFWRSVNSAQEMAARGDLSGAARQIESILDGAAPEDSQFDGKRRQVVDLIIRSYGLDVDLTRPQAAAPHASAPVSPPASVAPANVSPAKAQPRSTTLTIKGKPEPLGPIEPGGEPGTSLVTCAMNRTVNLLRALPTWLRSPEISEIVIVDWSSDEPVREALSAAGFDSRKIRVVRVEGEPRWILSYAFNTGFRLARHARILKVDADILLEPDFFSRNPLDDGTFVAGNWRKAAEGQAHVNGFFYVAKSDLAAIGGFNEFITTYGWDDDDIYTRLVNQGVDRRDVAPGTIHHQDHSDEERLGAKEITCLSARQEITGSTMYCIRRNRFLANVMPVWTNTFTPLPLEGGPDAASDLALRRSAPPRHRVPPHIDADADYYALLEMTSWRLGQRVMELDRTRLGALVSRPFGELSKLDVEVLLASPEGARPALGGHLAIDIGDSPLSAGSPAGDALAALTALARSQGMMPVLLGDAPELHDSAGEPMPDLPYLAGQRDLGEFSPTTPEQLKSGLRRTPGQNFRLALRDALGTAEAPLAAPAIAKGRARIFIDAQHGLGNRLRAIGSAAAIAQATERELVIVWHPDHHCEGVFSDLYDYPGAVIEEAFVTDAAAQGCTVFNYMEIEDGAGKDAPIAPDLAGDLYLRSAYVLNSPHSNWSAENRFLRSLTPVEPVRALVTGVRTPNDLSAHIRMVGGTEYEHLAYEATDNWTQEGHAEIDFWRRKSHFSHFMRRIDTLIAEGRAGRVFLAADKPETYEEFMAVYGDRVAYLPRELYDRSAEQLQYALADALLLGSSPLLLGSTWSSFSELAMRLSEQEMTIEMSGKDF